MKREGLARPVAWIAVDANGKPVPHGIEGGIFAAASPAGLSEFPDWQVVPVYLAAHEAREVVRWDCPTCRWSTPAESIDAGMDGQGAHDYDVSCRARVRALVEG